MGLVNKFKLKFFRFQWRVQNKNNETYPGNLFNKDLVCVGIKTYGILNVTMNNMYSKLVIGNYCSIASNVSFILSGDHYLHNFSTFPIRVKCFNEKNEAISKGDIIIDDDVWIGEKAIILSGVHIAQGAVIGAGSVVTKDVPAYAIVAGNPACVLKYRFNEAIRAELLNINFCKVMSKINSENIESFYTEIDDTQIIKELQNL